MTMPIAKGTALTSDGVQAAVGCLYIPDERVRIISVHRARRQETDLDLPVSFAAV